MRVAMAQLNPVVGDVPGNTALVLDALLKARADRADVLVTSELALIGYPPRDLLWREGVVEACERAVTEIARAAGDLFVIVGHPRRVDGTRPFRNSASVCHDGNVIAVCDKQLLPGYDVFDEDRYFEPGRQSCSVEIKGRRVGVVICEDLWRADDVDTPRRYSIEPVSDLTKRGCDLLISLNASPFVLGKWKRHLDQLAEIARDTRTPIVAVNQVGANDDLVFDGRSMLVSREGSLAKLLPGFEAALETFDAFNPAPARAIDPPWHDSLLEIWHALVLGLKDYCRKTGHRQVHLGLSGGIDSALVAAIAAAALGPGNVHGVMMPSKFSSPGSISDALDVARRLSLGSCEELPIREPHQMLEKLLVDSVGDAYQGVPDENVQARLRGILLMALSNARGSLVLSTSNKSEMAVGYSTLYGDMCGAVAVLGDLSKTRIWALSKWINQHHQACGFDQPPIPDASISKPPSAELRPNQTDQDTLPPYETLDQIVERFIEREESAATIIRETGIPAATVERVLKMIDRAEYKRFQAPIVPKLTPRAFGPGRPMPVVMKGLAYELAANGQRLNASKLQPGVQTPVP